MRRILTLLLPLLILLAILPGSSLAQHSFWRTQNPIPTGSDLIDIAMTGRGRATAVGYNGTILQTMDSGRSWSQSASPVASALQSVAFVDSLDGFACGFDRTLLATSDGGKSWQRRSIDEPAGFRRIRFGSATTGVMVGGTLIPTSSIMCTTDGGATWNSRPRPTEQSLNDLCFVDSANVWAVGDMGTILYSGDGGREWTLQHVDTGSKSADLRGVWFINAMNGFAVGDDNRIMRTTDGGESWRDIHWIPYSTASYYAVAFSDPLHGVITGNGIGVARETSDGGETWTQSPIGLGPLAVAFDSDGVGLAVGIGGLVRRTTDHGATWPKMSIDVAPFVLNDVCFTDSTTGMAVGANGLVVRTTDGGEHWTQLSSFLQKNFTSLDCADPLHCVAVGRDGLVRGTTDGGGTWIASGWESINFSAVVMRGRREAWAVGGVGTIIHSSDGGINWSPQTSGSTRLLMDVSFCDSSFGMVVGTSGTLLRTTDAGVTWSSVSPGLTTNLTRVNVIDRTHTFATAISGFMLVTTDGGEHWIERAIPSSKTILSQTFIDAREGWIAFEAGDVLHTIDGGERWVHEPTGVSEAGTAVAFTGISFTDNRHGWLVGAKLILRYVPGDTATGATITIPYPDPGLCGGTAEPIPVTLHWSRSPEAAIYRLQIARDSLFDFTAQPPVLDAPNLSDTFRMVAGLDPGARYYWRVLGYNSTISSAWSPVCSFTTRTISGTDRSPADASTALRLDLPHPHPVAARATIGYDLPHEGAVRLTIHDLEGRERLRLVDELRSAGNDEQRVSDLR